MESTYGDRNHSEEKVDFVGELTKILQRTFNRGGNVVIPSFAVGRTQELLYFLRQIKEEKLVRGHENFPVYVDSPLAVEATGIFQRNSVECFDEEAMELMRKGINPIMFPGLHLAITSDESKAINFESTPKVIISASGMCEAGRIRHHLKHNLWRRESTILFVGYQAVGTLGRALVEGATTVKLFGEEIHVQARIQVLAGVSGHADQAGLLKWAGSFRDNKPKKVFVVHGDDQVTTSFAKRLESELGYQAMAPFSGTVYDLAANQCIYEAQGIPAPKKTPVTAAAQKVNEVYARLLSMGQRLMVVIHKNEGGANKDLKKFANEIQKLCDKWERD